VTVVALVEHERAWVGRLIAGWGIAIAVACVCAALGLGVFAFGQGRWMALPAPLPLVAWVLVTALVCLAASLTARRLATEATARRVALAVEHDRRLRRGALRGALEVGDSGALGRRGAQQMLSQIGDGRGLSPTLRGRARLRTAAVVLLAIVAIAALSAAAVTMPDGWTALAHPVRAWRGTLLPPLRIDAPSDVARGQPVHVRIAAPGRLRVAVQRRVTGAPWTTGWYRVVGGYTRITTDPVDADLSIVATDGRAVSETVTVRAVDRPFVGGVALRAEYPAYLHRSPEVLPAGEDARVPRGTRIELSGSASTDLAGIALVRGGRRGAGPTGADSVPLHSDGRRFSGRLVAEPWAEGRWDWRAAGTSGAIADVPAALQLEVIPDSAPTVEILAPAHDTIVGSGDKVVLALQASDDHGLSEVVLHSHRVPVIGGGAPGADATQRIADSAGPRWTGNATLDLGSRGLQPGDVMRVRAEVTDNSPWRQTGASRELVLRVPSLSEQRTLVRSAADSAVAQVAATAAAERQLEQRTEDAARARGPRPSTGASSSPTSAAQRGGGAGSPAQSSLPYEAAEQARALGQQQRQLANRVDSLRKQTQQLQRQLQQAGALDSGLVSRLSEAQRLLSDALTPELRAQLDQLDQGAASLSSGETRQSLADLAQQQQRMRDQLDKTVDVLKRAALEGSMQTLRDEARDIAKAERSTQPQTKSGSPAQPPPAEQQLADRSRDLSRDVEQLAKRLSAAQASTGAREVGAARGHVDSSAQAMQSSNAQTAATEMDRAAQQLGDARQAQVSEWKSALTSELDRSIQETMQLAQQERDLARAAQSDPAAQSPGGGQVDKSQLEAEQSAVQQGTDRASERLQRAGRQSALVSAGAQRAVGEARAKVQQATQTLRDPQAGLGGAGGAGGAGGQQSAAAMRDAAQALTDAAAALVRDRERAASASSSSGLAEMLQQMRQLAEQQGQLNAQAQGLSLMPGGKKTGQGAGSSQQLADGERQVAKSLDDVGQGEGGGGADALAREARQIAEALDRSGLDSATIARQQRLYHRLLDAGHTLEQDQRDSTGKRESQAATGSDAFAPTNASAVGRVAVKYPEPTWAELRGLSSDERQIVIDYFKRINASPNAEP